MKTSSTSSSFCVESFLRCGVVMSANKGQVIIGWGKRTWLTEPSQIAPISFYFPDYFLETNTPWFIHEYHLEMRIEELSTLLSKPVIDFIPWKQPDEILFTETFNEIQEAISTGILVKAVPFSIESSEIPMIHEQLKASLSSALAYLQNHSAYVYGFWGEEGGILGVSPEVLFSCNQKGELRTMACAGTKSTQEDELALLSDPKEIHEHTLVVQGIENALTPYGVCSIGQRHVLKLSSLMHLITPITVELKKTLPFEQIVRTLHPTPAVGAFPKEPGMAWLKRYQQKVPRGRFAAPVGCQLLNNQISHCYVAIRNVQWDHARMWIAAGCGVVSESRCEREWREINLKLQTIKNMLAL